MSYIYEDLGRIDYAVALERQEEVFDALLSAKMGGGRAEGRLFFCEHNPVITIGRSGREENLLVSQAALTARGVALYRVNRGGDITYHGPGQITVYPIFDLEEWGMGLRRYVYILEEISIRFLALYGIEGGRMEGAAGVWIDALRRGGSARKICAVGVRSSRYVTMHGMALNVNADLRCFSMINPCGFKDKGVTSVSKELGAEQDLECAKLRLKTLFLEFFPPAQE
ncbi:MAG: lipoyl(octanoyl) transferase LipB [Tannerellaceae bacterium]|jgi:lipoyl(octanoyl) transferase|nr:lipoyl(octanoyl) transferase LipB [Tannerellaceae bacterium]